MTLRPSPRARRVAAAGSTLAVLLGVTATCQSNTEPRPAASITMSATIDGAAWVATRPKHGVPPYANYTAWDSTLVLSGLRAFGSDSSLGIVLVAGPVTGAGVYPLGAHSSRSYATLFRSTGDVYAGTYRTHWWYSSDSTGGTLTVTGFDPATRHVEGSFSFAATDSTGLTRQVGAGVFAGTWLVPLD